MAVSLANTLIPLLALSLDRVRRLSINRSVTPSIVPLVAPLVLIQRPARSQIPCLLVPSVMYPTPMMICGTGIALTSHLSYSRTSRARSLMPHRPSRRSCPRSRATGHASPTASSRMPTAILCFQDRGLSRLIPTWGVMRSAPIPR